MGLLVGQQWVCVWSSKRAVVGFGGSCVWGNGAVTGLCVGQWGGSDGTVMGSCHCVGCVVGLHVR